MLGYPAGSRLRRLRSSNQVALSRQSRMPVTCDGKPVFSAGSPTQWLPNLQIL